MKERWKERQRQQKKKEKKGCKGNYSALPWAD